jgi:hypothetical protein
LDCLHRKGERRSRAMARRPKTEDADDEAEDHPHQGPPLENLASPLVIASITQTTAGRGRYQAHIGPTLRSYGPGTRRSGIITIAPFSHAVGGRSASRSHVHTPSQQASWSGLVNLNTFDPSAKEADILSVPDRFALRPCRDPRSLPRPKKEKADCPRR